MRSLLLRSVMIAVIVIPFVAARDPHPVRGLKKAMFLFVVFNLLYMIALRFLFTRLS